MLGLVVLRQGLESGEGGLVGLEGLEGGEQGLRSVRLLWGVNDVNLVLVVLWRGLWGDVVDVMNLRGAGVVVGLLDGVGSLRGRLGGLGVMGLVDWLCLWGHRALVVTLQTPSALVGMAAVPVELHRQGGRLLLGLVQQLCGGVVGLCLVHLVALVEQLCGRVVCRRLFVHLMKQLSGGVVRLPPVHLVRLVEQLGGGVVRLHLLYLVGLLQNLR